MSRKLSWSRIMTMHPAIDFILSSRDAELAEALNARDLARTACLTTTLRVTCDTECERRVRQILGPAHFNISVKCQYAGFNRDVPWREVQSYVALCAGGWSKLLAGREGLLNTCPLPEPAVQAAPRVQIDDSHGLEESLRERTDLHWCEHGVCDPSEPISSHIVLWDICRDNKPLWSSAMPLTPQLAGSMMDISYLGGPVIDMVNIFVLCTAICPESTTFPGARKDSRKDCAIGPTPQYGRGFTGVREACHQYQISVGVGDDSLWSHRISILGPHFAETLVTELKFDRTDLLAQAEQPRAEVPHAISGAGALWMFDLARGTDGTIHVDVCFGADDHAWERIDDRSRGPRSEQSAEEIRAREPPALYGIPTG